MYLYLYIYIYFYTYSYAHTQTHTHTHTHAHAHAHTHTQVSRGVFISALKKHDSVLLIPGGQVEMISSRSESTSIVIDTSHRGFVKLALEQAAQSDKPLHLMPTYAFNETRTLDNVRAPKVMQRWVTKVLRANVIYLPYGQFGLPGYPRTVPVSLLSLSRPLSFSSFYLVLLQSLCRLFFLAGLC